MARMDSYCTVSECESPTRQGRTYCDFHEKRHQRGQSLTAPKAKRLIPKAQLVEAAIRLADAEDDAAYDKAERDLVKTARRCSSALHGELVRRGMAEAKARGVKHGPPFRSNPAEVQAVLAREGSVSGAARALGISRHTVRRALKRGAQPSIAERAV